MTQTTELLRAAREAIRAGKRLEARHILEQVVRQDPGAFNAWLWLAGVTSSPRASLAYLDRAEALRPGDARVAQARRWAHARARAAAEPEDAAIVTTSTEAIRPTTRARKPTPETAAASAPSSRRRWPWTVALGLLLLALLAFGASIVEPGIAQSLVAEIAGIGGGIPSEPGLDLDQDSVPPAPEATTLPATAIASVADDDREADRGEAGAAPETDQTALATATSTPLPTATALPQMPPKNVRASADVRPTWTPTPLPTPTPTPTPVPTDTPVPTEAPPAVDLGGIPVGSEERWIDVDLSTQSLVAYIGAEPVYSTLVSSGLWQFPTVTGQFRIYLRYEAQDMSGFHLGYNYYLPSVPYVMYFFEDYALHGAYWHNNFGTPMSHGCVNLAVEDAEWLYEFANVGTLVNVHY